MTDHEHVVAIRAAHTALMEAVRAAEADGLTIGAELQQHYYGPWSIALNVKRVSIVAESDGKVWKQREGL